MGEKPSKYFLNLENKNFISKHIRELKTKGGGTIQNLDSILKEMKIIYSDLYQKKSTEDKENTTFHNISDNMTKLSDLDRTLMEREILLEDLEFIVNKSKNNKSPGPEGFSNELKKKWSQIKILPLKLINSYRSKGSLNETQTNGIITCIPKGGKIRNEFKNWRPITLLNSNFIPEF